MMIYVCDFTGRTDFTALLVQTLQALGANATYYGSIRGKDSIIESPAGY
jgi:hypothetical protein